MRQTPHKVDQNTFTEREPLEAEDVRFDQTTWELSDCDFTTLLAMLSEPPAPNDNLKRLVARKAPWDR